MALFSAVCGVCGKECGLNRYKIKRSNAWMCPACLKRLGGLTAMVNGKSFTEATIEEIKEMIGQRESVQREEITAEMSGDMELTFANAKGVTWVLTDGSVLIKQPSQKTAKSQYSLKEIAGVAFIEPQSIFPGSINIQDGDGNIIRLFYGNHELLKAKEAYQYLDQNAGTAEQQEQRARMAAFRAGKEMRKRCNVCGATFCYTYEDYQKNEKLKKSVASDKRFAALSALSVSTLQSAVLQGNANSTASKIRDFDTCPTCGSKDLTELDENITASGPAPVSPTEEIKKYKELLDMGIITQEEFEVKKKDLLGL